MRSNLFSVTVLGVLIAGAVCVVAAACTDKNTTSGGARQPNAATANVSFSDGTLVESVSVDRNTEVIQIKHSDGRICYAITSNKGDDNAGTGSGITCLN